MEHVATRTIVPAGLPISPAVRDRIARLGRDPDPVCAYIHDLDELARHARAMRFALPGGCELFYAIKANGAPALLETLAPIVDGFEAASGGELALLRTDQPAARTLFGGPGKLDSELEAAVAAGCDAIHVESAGELRRLAGIVEQRADGRRVPVMLRLNPRLSVRIPSRLVMTGGPSPFGMDEAGLAEAMEILDAQPCLHLAGLHIHAMSHQSDALAHLHLVEAYLDHAAEIGRRYGRRIKTLNCGGGMGVDYLDPARSFDWALFCDGLYRLRQGAAAGIGLRFEVGRFLAASCATYVCEVIDLKSNHGEWFAILRGGTHHFRLPAAQGHDHPFEVIERGRGERRREIAVSLVGQLCTPKDVFARRQPVASIAIGDLVAFPLAGAYGWSISHHDFLMHPPPRMVFIGGGA